MSSRFLPNSLFESRVTRLGDSLPNGQLYKSYRSSAKIWVAFVHGKSYVIS
jgi:hypothetical protein